jgi:large subunit ribosomal protein L25
MEETIINARIRHEAGKGAARKLRRDNEVPAIFYGPNSESLMLAVNYADLRGILKGASGENTILGLQIKSESGSEKKTVMLKELQSHPVKDTVFHVDFYEISMDKEITVDIPIQLLNTPVGVTNGGVLQHIKRELTVSCLPGNIIDVLELDVSGLDIGDSLHVSDLALPDGIESLDEETETVTTVAAPTVKVEEEEIEEAEEEAIEGEKAEEGAEPEPEAEAKD